MCNGEVLALPLVEREPLRGNEQFHTYHLHKCAFECYQSTATISDITRDKINGTRLGNSEICDERRLTLVHLPKSVDQAAEDPLECINKHAENPFAHVENAPDFRWRTPVPPEMPDFFLQQLRSICSHCECKGDLLWKNLYRQEHHFDSCFRYIDEFHKPSNVKIRCFLKLYSLRVPSLTRPMVTFSMVHHIRSEGHKFVPESTFAFLVGGDSKDVRQLLMDQLPRWQDNCYDHTTKSAGLTPRLFMAALLTHYGSLVSPKIRWTGDILMKFDDELHEAVKHLNSGQSDKEVDQDTTESIKQLNNTLVEMTQTLTGIRSTVHYLAESAQLMAKDIIPFQDYIRARLNDWVDDPDSTKLKKELKKLDIFKEQLRDHDKLIMVRNNMFRYKQDIKSLQQHIDINVGMVRNVIAARDRSIQQSIARNADRDGSKVKVMAFLTAVFLPGTFMGILLTTPIFNWTEETKPVVVKLPTKIYWGATGPMTIFLLAGLYFSTYPAWVSMLIDYAPLDTRTRNRLKKAGYFKECYSKRMSNKGEGEEVRGKREGVNGTV